MEGIGAALRGLAIIAIVGLVAIFGWFGFGVYNVIFSDNIVIIETKQPVKIDYRLETNGKIIDTVFIYTIIEN